MSLSVFFLVLFFVFSIFVLFCAEILLHKGVKASRWTGNLVLLGATRLGWHILYGDCYVFALYSSVDTVLAAALSDFSPKTDPFAPGADLPVSVKPDFQKIFSLLGRKK